MGQVWGNVGVVAIFILIGAFFAAAEIALVSLRESQMERLSARGRRGRILAALASQPNRYLAAVQVGVTLAGFVSAGFGAAQIAPALAERLVAWGWSDGLASTVSFIVVTILIAYVSLVIGELVPKRLALQGQSRSRSSWRPPSRQWPGWRARSSGCCRCRPTPSYGCSEVIHRQGASKSPRVNCATWSPRTKT